MYRKPLALAAPRLAGMLALVLLAGARLAAAKTLAIDLGWFPPVRYDENYNASADPAKRTGFFEA